MANDPDVNPYVPPIAEIQGKHKDGNREHRPATAPSVRLGLAAIGAFAGAVSGMTTWHSWP